MPKRQTPFVMGNARFTVYSGGCVRLEYAWNGRFAVGPSLLVGPRPAAGVPADIRVRGKTLTITTPGFELRYTDDGQVFNAENLKIIHRNHVGQRMIWVPGKKDAGNLGTVTRCLDQWKWCGGPQHFPIEGILSTDGGHFVPDEPRVYWSPEHDWPECLGHAIPFDGYFFAYGNDYRGALKDFITVFGRIPMVPRWAFGFWYSRWHAYTDREFVELARRYGKEGIPIDVMIIDTDWRTAWGGYDWNRKYFPNPRRAMKKLHEMGLHTSLNDHPGYDNYDALPDWDSHIRAIGERLGPLPHQGQWACDWSNKRAVRAWCDLLLGPRHDEGMDFWWIDGWVKPPFPGADSQLWANRIYFELCERKTRQRGLVLARWGGVGSHRYPVQFSGDTPSEWHMLQHQVEFTVRSCGLGAIYWSHDIGGFFGREIDEELFVRWSQFGAMSPIFRTHSDHGIREPWNFGPRGRDLFRKQTRIRYALNPYFYSLAREAHETGLPIIRPLYLHYNDNDGGALGRKHQYLIGRDLLVVPADGPADKKTGLFRKRAYFPNDLWYNLETPEIVQGMRDGFVEAPLDRIPTYVRGGAIIPCQKVDARIGVSTREEVQFDYYPDPNRPSEFVLYEDDGAGKGYEKGQFAKTTVRGFRAQHVTEVGISAPRGRYEGMPRARTYVVRVGYADRPGRVRAEASVDGGAWKRVPCRLTQTVLAGTVESAHPFVEVRVKSRNRPVAIRVTQV